MINQSVNLIDRRKTPSKHKENEDIKLQRVSGVLIGKQGKGIRKLLGLWFKKKCN
jgi:hypothetical protein